jgi:hypothetical protein
MLYCRQLHYRLFAAKRPAHAVPRLALQVRPPNQQAVPKPNSVYAQPRVRAFSAATRVPEMPALLDVLSYEECPVHADQARHDT